jgi:phage terminase large subunit
MRSGKTYAAQQTMIKRGAENPKYVGRMFRRDATVAKKAFGPDLFEILQEQFPEVWSRNNWNEQKACYTFPTNGEQAGKIYLGGTNDPETLKGCKQTDALFDEATEHSLEAKRQMEGRTQDLKIYAWNPSASDHWIFTETLRQPEDRYFYVHSTFEENPYLDEEIKENIRKWEPTKENIAAGTASKWHWDVYGLGKRGQRPGAVYTNWEITDDWPMRMACNRWCYGLDFGFSIDPTVLIEFAYFQDRVYLRELVYEIGLINLRRENEPSVPSLEQRLIELDIGKRDLIRADAAHPDLIAELVVAGYNVVKFSNARGPKYGWVKTGILKTQQHRILVHRASYNVIKEFNNYTWKRDPRTDVQLDEPIGDFNHAMDPLRGCVMDELTPKRIDYSGDRKRSTITKQDVFAGLRRTGSKPYKLMQRR